MSLISIIVLVVIKPGPTVFQPENKKETLKISVRNTPGTINLLQCCLVNIKGPGFAD